MSIVMEQFQISNCEECDIWLFDCTAGVYVDACRFCRVFIAAS